MKIVKPWCGVDQSVLIPVCITYILHLKGTHHHVGFK